MTGHYAHKSPKFTVRQRRRVRRRRVRRRRVRRRRVSHLTGIATPDGEPAPPDGEPAPPDGLPIAVVRALSSICRHVDAFDIRQVMDRLMVEMGNPNETASNYGLTLEERLVIFAFTLPTRLYTIVNRALREQRAVVHMRAFTDLFDSGLAKLPSHSGILSRGVSLINGLGDYGHGRVITWNAYSSSTDVHGVALMFSGGGVVFSLHSRSAVSIGGLSAIPRESEYVFPRGSHFIVTTPLRDVDGTRTIDMSEIRLPHSDSYYT